MSEPRMISPLLDEFNLGSSMSCHSGVQCYPAMRVDSDERYIVKSISVPESQTRLEALLLTGAYPDAEAARGYFRELAQGILGEAAVLEKLSTQRGFLPFQAHQCEPMEEGVGYDCYFVSPYRRSLERYLKRNPMTHLSAVNMGIDLCAALVICRESGYLYVDLKPANIFLSGEQEYHIGDLGFVSLDSLKYASLPDRYRSFWTAPEVADAYAAMSDTMDIYALGLVLYQVYNNGALPFDCEDSRKALMEKLAAGEPMPAPEYADYEMAQIILKACAYDPAERWQSPNEMGHALIMYMQRNGANDVPIGPPVIEAPVAEEAPLQETEASEEAVSEETVSTEALEAAEEQPAVESPEAAEAEEAGAEATDDIFLNNEEIPSEAESESPGEAEEEDDGEPEDESDDWIDQIDAILAQDEADGEGEDTMSLRQILEDSKALPEEDEALDSEALSEDTAGILSQADELIAHEAPDPVVAPEPIEIPMPAPIVPEGQEASEAEAYEYEDAYSDEEEYEEEPKKGRKLVGWIIAILILALLGTGAFYYYNEYYLQEVTALSAAGEGNQMTVSVTSELDESLLTVVCVDQYGKKLTSPVIGGVAAFLGLDADTQYTITLEAEGFYKLTGQVSTQYYTLPQTNVTGFTAATGPEDGSVILSVTAEGPAVESWVVEYAAEGQAPASISFTGNMITIPGLQPGTEYTFTLMSSGEVELVGQTQLSYVASNSVYARDLAITGQDGSITLTWNAPEGITVTQWTARCFNSAGYSQSFATAETTATFTGIDASADYTVEVIAEGMNQGTILNVTANPITVSNLTTQVVDSCTLAVSWEHEGQAPEGGWLLVYTVDGSTEQHVIQCSESVAVIEPAAPGSHYDLSVQTANSTTVFNGTDSVDVPKPDYFSQYNLSASEIAVSLYKAPEKEGWTYSDVTDEDKASTFAAGETAGVVLQTDARIKTARDNVTTVYAVWDANDKFVCISSTSAVWNDMWDKGHCVLEVPQLPTAAGQYKLNIYMNGQLVSSERIYIE